MVTHLVAWADVATILAEARAAFGGEVEQATCDTTVTVLRLPAWLACPGDLLPP